jgi:hypothetical protein
MQSVHATNSGKYRGSVCLLAQPFCRGLAAWQDLGRPEPHQPSWLYGTFASTSCGDEPNAPYQAEVLRSRSPADLQIRP